MEPQEDIAWTFAWNSSAKPNRDLFAHRALENAGGCFQQDAIACICREWAGKQGTAKQFKASCQANGIQPHHPSAWGGLTLLMKQSGLLQPVDPSNDKKPRLYHVLASH
jgi:hypothetical protein